MPQMANITIKKLDGTTDIVYNALNPSAGDRTKALWRTEAVGSVAANRNTAMCSSRSSVNGQYRIVDLEFTVPETYTDSTTGQVLVRTRALAKLTFTTDTRASDSTNGEAAAQLGNFVRSSLFQQVLQSGFAPN